MQNVKEKQYVTIEQARRMIDPNINFDASEYEREHLLMLARSILNAASGPGVNWDNLAKTADKYISNHTGTKWGAEFALLVSARNVIRVFSST